MKPWHTLATAPGADGKQLVLQERDGTYVIRVGGHELMSSAKHSSEEALATAGLEHCPAKPSVLIGGLGLGYTLRAALERVPSAHVVVAEISAAVVSWNRELLGPRAASSVADPKVTIEICDIGRLVAKTSLRFDAILLDVDNGPSALARDGNQQLYAPAGLAAFARVLNPGGVLAVWSAGPAQRFLERLRAAGFDTEERRLPPHTIILGKLRRLR